MELPPRTRRIRPKSMYGAIAPGTTSAHAENTSSYHLGCPCCWNYLRARGEYCRALNTGMTTLELPPRTRRILSLWLGIGGGQGTTSAHAENTSLSLVL